MATMTVFADRQKIKMNSPQALRSGRRSPAALRQPPLEARQPVSNQAAQKFAQTCPLALPSPVSCPFGGICHSCPPRVQAKFQVGQPGDKYEQEADRVAEEILRQPEPMTEGGPGSLAPPQPLSLMRSCAPCDEELRRLPLEECEEPRGPEEEVVTMLPKELPHQTPPVSPPVEAAISGSLAGGSPLPGALRDFYEPRFGQDFSGVRLHMDAQAAGAAQTVQARAFTLGHHIVLGSGEYAPETEKGRKLLAHELTHVVQQRAGMAPPAIPLIQLTNGAPAAVEPPFLDCIPDITGVVHQEVINEMIQDATELAIEWIGDSIDALTRLIDNTGTPDDSLALQNHFPGGRRHFIRNRFRNMRTILQRTNIDIFVCNPADSHYCLSLIHISEPTRPY